MKKSILELIILVLLIVNTVITVLMFTKMSSEVSSANDLISKVAAAIELDVAASDSDETGIPLEQQEGYSVIGADDKKLVVLKKGDDGKEHYLQLSCDIVMNTASKAYESYHENMESYKNRLQSIIQDVISSKTYDELLSDQQGVKTEIKDKMNALFGASDFIISVDFADFTPQ